MKYGCIGARLGHSFSPEIHAMLGAYDYRLHEVAEDELAPFLHTRDFRGINVTIPYKQAVIPYLDRISDTAAAIGAVNTIINRDGVLYGDNTDFYGLRSLIQRMGLNLLGKKVLILGTGGTSRTAHAVAENLGALEIHLVSRHPGAGSIGYDEIIRSHADADILINTTPCGMFPDAEACPIDLSHFTCLQGVVDVIFNPLASQLVLTGRERGIPAQGGLYMLVAQAAAASALFTGVPVGLEKTEAIYQRLLRQKQNIVLIGMPGSGKTTVGRVIAEKLGRSFADVDEMIVAKAGKSISDIFAQDGEEAFRAMESNAIREISGQTGMVIATGGGSILRRENARHLLLNGRLVLLDRPLSSLLPTEDRPLADSWEKITALYQRREPVYRSCADVVVPGEDTAEETASAVLSAFEKE